MFYDSFKRVAEKGPEPPSKESRELRQVPFYPNSSTRNSHQIILLEAPVLTPYPVYLYLQLEAEGFATWLQTIIRTCH